MPEYPKVNYIGNKEKLADWILNEMPVKEGRVLDLFAGGCSVSYALKARGYSVIANDILYADYVIARALIENQGVKLKEEALSAAYDPACAAAWEERFSILQNRLYYPEEIRELAALTARADRLEGDAKYLFLALLRRAMIRKLPYSRMNVPWDQIQRLRDEDYSYARYGRRRAYHNQSFTEHMRENLLAYNRAVFRGAPCRADRCDALERIRKTDWADVVYIDPPYPSTMNNYDAFYGLFDEAFDAKKEHMDFTQTSVFLEHMELLVRELLHRTGYILISQNSRVRPDPEEMRRMLSAYGRVDVREKRHNYQVTGKEHKNGSRELLFVLRLQET